MHIAQLSLSRTHWVTMHIEELQCSPGAGKKNSEKKCRQQQRSSYYFACNGTTTTPHINKFINLSECVISTRRTHTYTERIVYLLFFVHVNSIGTMEKMPAQRNRCRKVKNALTDFFSLLLFWCFLFCSCYSTDGVY